MSDESECGPARARGQVSWRAEFDAEGPVQERFRAYLAARVPAIHQCHESERARYPRLASGELVFTFTIAPDGRLVDVKLVVDELDRERLVRCIVAVLGSWRVPVSNGSEPTPGTLRLELRPVGSGA